MVLAALITNEVAHVLDNANHRDANVIEHGNTLLAVGESHLLRSRHDDRTCHRAVLRERELDVARSRRKVHKEVVELAPAHVVDEVLDHLRNHRSAPDGRLVGIRKHAHRDDADAPLRFDWCNRIVFKNFRSLVDAEHETHTRAVNVSIENTHASARKAERHSEVRRHGRFADTALATSHSNHMRHFANVRILRSLSSRIIIAHATLRRSERHFDFSGTKAFHDGNALVLEAVTNRACRSREFQIKGNLRAINFQVLNKV